MTIAARTNVKDFDDVRRALNQITVRLNSTAGAVTASASALTAPPLVVIADYEPPDKPMGTLWYKP